MLEILLGLGIAALAAGAAVWRVGAREPVFAVRRGSPAFFVALRHADAPVEPLLASGVRETWRADARLVLVGPEPWWHRFLVVTGGRAGELPLALGPETADAYVAELELLAPPAPLLGLLRVLHVLGLRTIPRGETRRDPAGLGLRPELLPSAERAAALLAQPAAWAPVMVNFLRYRATPRYPQPPPRGAASTGRGAYGRYGLVAVQTVYRAGGHLHFAGRVRRVLRAATGWEAGSDWDDVAVMGYPEPEAILTMERVPAYRAALVHRDAGLEATALIACAQRRAAPADARAEGPRAG